jgi:homoserine kinase
VTLLRVRAPATTANLGPGYDTAGAALGLWNEVVVSEGGTPDREHLGVQAFALLADPGGYDFSWTDAIPRERGLGSSASVVALGLVAGALVAGDEPDPERLLALGVELEGHADNLAAALAGGVCLTWEGHIARLADTLPLTPVAVVPNERVNTKESRAALPEQVSHADATHTVARAALLGAAIATQDAGLFAAALDDRLHEPHRAASSPLLAEVRTALPDGAAGATLSGSGPTVIVWAHDAEACARSLAEQFADAQILTLAVVPGGAAAV